MADATKDPAQKKSKRSLILIVLLLAMTGAAGFFAWSYFLRSPVKAAAVARPETAVEEEAPAESESAPEPDSKGGHGGTHDGGDRGAQSTVVNFEPFLVNLADRDAPRYLKVTIRLQVSRGSAEKIAGAEALTSKMRDSIITTLSTKVADQIRTLEGKEQLKAEISEKLNAFLPGKPVKAVFFTDFVVQI